MNVIGFLSERKHDMIEQHGETLHVDMSKISELVKENLYLKSRVNELESQLLVARVM